MTAVHTEALPLQAGDGHGWQLLASIPAQPLATLLWLPAMGVAAKHYRPFADALAARGIATFVHEWRGNGSSNRRASHLHDWGYAELLEMDLPASEAAIAARLPDAERIVGGHSLGGQLACCRLAIAPNSARRIWLVASGAPYWRAFPRLSRYALPLAFRFLPWLADRCGALPGRRLGFAGQEARGVIRDWARSAVTGRYSMAVSRGDPAPTEGGHGDSRQGHGPLVDLELPMGSVETVVQAVLLQRDWLAPASSLRFLLTKMRPVSTRVDVLDATALGAEADHFEWMKHPHQVVARLMQ